MIIMIIMIIIIISLQGVPQLLIYNRLWSGMNRTTSTQSYNLRLLRCKFLRTHRTRLEFISSVPEVFKKKTFWWRFHDYAIWGISLYFFTITSKRMITLRGFFLLKPNGHRSTSQRSINVEHQLSSTILYVNIWLRNRWFCNTDQPKINFSTIIQPKINRIWSWNINVEKWLKFGWQLVDIRLRSLFLVDHCYNINYFSTKYQRWYLVVWEIDLCP